MKKKGYLIFTIFALALCILPLTSMLLGYEAGNRENRPLAREAQLITREGKLNLSFPAEFDKYFEDHFGLREEMVTLFHSITMKAARYTLNKDVIVGKNGMLYYAETLDDYLGISVLSDDEIARAATVLRLQQEFAQSIGASFLFTAAPNKNTIYPEYMPSRYAVTNATSNREKLNAALVQEGVSTLDLAALLISHKQDGMLYHTHDTHWNERGAILAYDAIMASIFPDANTPDYIATYSGEISDYAGDLHNFVLPAVKGSEARPRFVTPTSFAADDGARINQDITFGIKSTCSDAHGATLYMMRDSFAISLIPYFGESVIRTVFSSEFPYNYINVLEEAPDTIVIELVERNIPNLLLSAPLMPALERQAPALPSASAKGELKTRVRSGHTQIFGCFDGENTAPIYIMLSGDDEHCFEAFPILEEDAYTMATDYVAAAGFSLTLPHGIAGEYSIMLVCGDVHVYMGKITLP